MKNNKKGISLIVLVITIIVMIILAASVVITLSNSNIINRATDATKKTSVAQVAQLSNIAWAEGYMENLRGTALNQYVQTAMKDYTDDYTIEVTDKGVIVTEGKTKQLNEYGFYYDVPYESDHEGYSYVYVIRENGILEEYHNNPINGFVYGHLETNNVTFENKKIKFASGWTLNVSEDGKTIDNGNTYNSLYTYSDLEYKDLQYNTKYYSSQGFGYIIVEQDNTIKVYNLDGTLSTTIVGTTVEKNSHVLLVDGTPILAVSMDGTHMYLNGNELLVAMSDSGIITFDIVCDGIEYKCQADVGMTWGEWINSSYNTMGVENISGTAYLTCNAEKSFLKTAGYGDVAYEDNLVLPWIYTLNQAK